MAPAPTSFNVIIIPADGTRPYYEHIGTVEVALPSPTQASESSNKDADPTKDANPTEDADLIGDGLQCAAADRHMVYNNDTRLFQPDFRLLPDACKTHWPREAWKHRTVIGRKTFHYFFTLCSAKNFETNQNANHLISGDIIVANVSGIPENIEAPLADQYTYYEDIGPQTSGPADFPLGFYPFFLTEISNVRYRWEPAKKKWSEAETKLWCATRRPFRGQKLPSLWDPTWNNYLTSW